MDRSARLGPAVSASVTVSEAGPRSPRRLERVLPTANVAIVVNLADDELRTYADDGTVRRHPGAVLCGPATRTRVIDTDETSLLTVGFRHGSAAAYVGASLHELTDAMVGLDELFGRDGATLRERVLEAATTAAKIELVERMLLARVATRSDRSAAVDVAVAAVGRGTPVHAVSAYLDVSTKQLARLFRRHVGMTPKRFARILRLQRTLRSVHASSDPDWATLAADHGYADQSHLIRDFRDLAGLTPTGYKRLATAEHNHVAFVQYDGALAT